MTTIPLDPMASQIQEIDRIALAVVKRAEGREFTNAEREFLHEIKHQAQILYIRKWRAEQCRIG